MNQDGPNKTQAALVKAVQMLCKPLIRLLIEKGFSFPQFRELMKELYIEVADEHFSLDGVKPNDSRIFVLTGIHRKDIKRIREQSRQGETKVISSASLSGEIIARWMSTPDYLDEEGNPRKLLKNREIDVAGFEQLVSSVSKDVRPRVILDEWLRLGIVDIKDNYIILNKSAFVTNKEFTEMAYYLGHNIHDHLASCVSNILAEDKPMLERSVYYASLTEDSVDKLNAIASKKGNELLQHLNKQAIKLYDADKSKADASHRIRLGVYWYQTQYKTDLEKSKEATR
jgi:ferredoxin-fold anticodon binding domain-containing protein